jgi:hypothetical protein
MEETQKVAGKGTKTEIMNDKGVILWEEEGLTFTLFSLIS